MANARGKVIVGFILQLLLYCAYILAGIAIIGIPSNPGPDRECIMQLKVYSGFGVVAILRTVVGLCIAFGRYLKAEPTYPSGREILTRVFIKIFLAIWGLALFGLFDHSCFPSLQTTNNPLWVLYSITVWKNVISAIGSVLTLKSSLQAASRLSTESRLNHASSRGLQFRKGSSFAEYMVESPLTNHQDGGGSVADQSEGGWDGNPGSSSGGDYNDEERGGSSNNGGGWGDLQPQRRETDATANFQDAYGSPQTRSPRYSARLT